MITGSGQSFQNGKHPYPVQQGIKQTTTAHFIEDPQSKYGPSPRTIHGQGVLWCVKDQDTPYALDNIGMIDIPAVRQSLGGLKFPRDTILKSDEEKQAWLDDVICPFGASIEQVGYSDVSRDPSLTAHVGGSMDIFVDDDVDIKDELMLVTSLPGSQVFEHRKRSRSRYQSSVPYAPEVKKLTSAMVSRQFGEGLKKIMKDADTRKAIVDSLASKDPSILFRHVEAYRQSIKASAPNAPFMRSRLKYMNYMLKQLQFQNKLNELSRELRRPGALSESDIDVHLDGITKVSVDCSKTLSDHHIDIRKKTFAVVMNKAKNGQTAQVMMY